MLTEEEISRLIRSQPAVPPDRAVDGLRRAAVLIPFLQQQDQWYLLFTRRTDTVQNHKGQVSFPGGASDAADQTPEDTALREAEEEIGLIPQHINILGRIPDQPTITNFLVTPVVARIHWPLTFRLSQLEVSRVFTIPLRWLADPKNREERPRTFPGGYHENVIYFQPYDGEILWGISAKIMVDLLEILQLAD
jgi:8-oxo-dGTP pyrophosphatase MutT (NUDIX family)